MANPEHLAILKQGVEVWNKWREEHPEIIPDLIGADLKGACLVSVRSEGTDFREHRLEGTETILDILKEPDLIGANFQGASFDGAILERANLEQADLRGTNLKGANLKGAKLVRADLRGANLERANLKEADLRGANLEGVNFNGANLEQIVFFYTHAFGIKKNLPAKALADFFYPAATDGPERLSPKHHASPEATEKKQERPKITVAYPEVISSTQWATVDLYLYLRAFRELVQAEIRRQQEKSNIDYSAASSEFPKSLPVGCPVKISLESTTLRINPSELTINWYEPYNRLSFRVCPIDDNKDGYSASLDVDVFADDLPAASMRLSIAVNSEAPTEHVSAASSDATWYEKVFASYAREDLELVKHLKERYEALGMHMFIDLDDLLSGVEWEKALADKIDKSDLFQLFWSKNARKAKYVTIEWKHALRASKIKGGRFIRPVYWDDKIPKVPKALADINFRKIKIAVS
ncbi:MAG: toll/interleukin-1 receptor domain-containing protein [Chlorobiaceae bacterium]|nr:toll/interleukin-1 receptor domain-containing protein [Chlorobiaceae bacterium]